MDVAFNKARKMYLSSLDVIVGFSVFFFCSLILIPLTSSYINLGSGFVRYSSLYMDMSPTQLAVFVFVGLASILFMSFFVSSIVTVVKLKETLDHVGFTKVAHSFYHYVVRVFAVLTAMAFLTVAIGTGLDYLSHATGNTLFRPIMQMLMVLIWVPFAFAPQILVLEDLDVAKSIKDSVNFIRRYPKMLFRYMLVGLISLMALAVVEVALGYVFIDTHKIITIVILSLVILPFMLIYGTELYLRRYALAHTKS